MYDEFKSNLPDKPSPEPTSRFRWVAWAFALGLFVAFSYNFATAQKSINTDLRIKEANIASCNRVNEAREEMNIRGEVLKEFLLSAAEVRENSAIAGTDPELNMQAAQDWRKMAGKIHEVEIVDCEEAFEMIASLSVSQ